MDTHTPLASILVVDDERDVRMVLVQAVRELGHTPVEAVNASEAMSRYDRERPDAVILDLMLPDLSGYEVLDHIRGRDRSGPPVIVVSATMTGKWSLRHGADAFVAKPFSVAALQRAVEDQMRASSDPAK